MSTVLEPKVPSQFAFPEDWSIADLRDHLGGVSAERVRLFPFPGTATEEQAVQISERGGGLYELVDGILVEKPVGQFESYLAGQLIFLLQSYLEVNRHGILLAPDGPFRLSPRIMRMPDVAFVAWKQLPDGKLPKEKVLKVCPDLAIEILSDSNTKREMKKKLGEYFEAGTRLVWYIDPRNRAATIYTALDEGQRIEADGTLDGRDLLPGFTLRLGDLFARAEGPPK